MKLDKLNLDGKKSSIEVLDKIFLAKINHKLVSSVLYKTNANYKGRHAKTKQQNVVIIVSVSQMHNIKILANIHAFAKTI